MPEMIDAELQLEPVLSVSERRHEHARVVDEQMDAAASVLGELTY